MQNLLNNAPVFTAFQSKQLCSLEEADHGSGAVHALSLHPHVRALAATGAHDGCARAVDLASGCVLWTSAAGDAAARPVAVVEWSLDGELLAVSRAAAASGSPAQMSIYDPRAGGADAVVSWQPHAGNPAPGVAFLGGPHADPRHIVTTGITAHRSHELLLWDIRSTAQPLPSPPALPPLSTSARVTPVFVPHTGLLIASIPNSSAIPVATFTSKSGSANAALIGESLPSAARTGLAGGNGGRAGPGDITARAATSVASRTPHRDIAVLPASALDVGGCEVVRIVRATAAGIDMVSGAVPRRGKAWDDVKDLCEGWRGGPVGSSPGDWLGAGDVDFVRPVKKIAPRSRPPTKTASAAASSSAAAPAGDGISTGAGPTQAGKPASAIPPRLTAEALKSSSSSSGGSGSNPAGGRGSVASVGSTSSSRAAALNLVRASKHRNNFPGTVKPELHHYELKPDLQAYPESDGIAVSPGGECIAVPWNGAGGLVAFCPVDRVGRWTDEGTLTYETGLGTVSDMAFAPVSANAGSASGSDAMIALGTETGTVSVLTVDIAGLGSGGRGVTSRVDLIGHESRVTRTVFHPSIAGLLASASGDPVARLWDVTASQELLTLPHPGENIVYDLAFSHDGRLVVSTARDSVARVWDPRISGPGRCAIETRAHEGQRTSRCVWLGPGSLFATTGFTKGSDRQIMVHDIRRAGDPVATVNVDVNSGPLMPYYDEDGGLLYVCGKGSGWVRSYEVEHHGFGSEVDVAAGERRALHMVSEHASATANSGLCMLPRGVLDVARVEVARFLRLAKDRVEPVSFFTPRTRKEYFQDDLYSMGARSRTALAGVSPSAITEAGDRSFAPSYDSLRPDGMPLLSEAPPPPPVVSAAEKFAKDIAADESAADAEKLFDSFADRIKLGATVEKHQSADCEGVDEDEWSD
jgi:WD40 repeat protein